MTLFDRDHWYEVFQSLRRNRLRTFLTACGVFWGVFMLVVMLGFGRGLEKGATRDFGNWAQNTVFVWGDVTGKAYNGQPPRRRIRFTMDDVAEVKSRIAGAELVLPRNNDMSGRNGNIVTRGDKTERFEIVGDEPAYLRLESLGLRQGRFLNDADLHGARKIAVIGPRVQAQLFAADEDPLGQMIQLGGIAFTVVGVFQIEGSGGHAEWSERRIFIPRTTFSRTFGTSNRVDYLAVLVAGDRASTVVEEEIKALLKKRHRVHPDDPRGIGSFNREKQFRKVNNLFLGIAGLTWTVGVLTLLAGAIGVSNIMMIAVAERTREIGIRKALGATPVSIMSQIVAEATVLTAMAGYLGLVTGVGVLEIAGRIVASMPPASGPKFFAAPEIDLLSAGLAALVLTIAGAVAGLAPARSAVAVRPVEALAHE